MVGGAILTIPKILHGGQLFMETVDTVEFVNWARTKLPYFLTCGVAKKLIFGTVDSRILQLQKSEGGKVSVGKLKELLSSDKRASYENHLLTVKGVFFASALFSYGWWQRKDPSLALPMDRNPTNSKVDDDIARRHLRRLQQFLFNGFEQWAPSWDVNDWNESGGNLIGQIGTNDEADSIPVIIQHKALAATIRGEMSDKLVANAAVTGLLVHSSRAKNHLGEFELALITAMREQAKKRDEQFYFLLVQEDDEKHGLEFSTTKVDYYTGYVWQCWAPNEWIPKRKYDAKIDDTFFVWQHANLADRDTVNLRMDGVQTDIKNIKKILKGHGLSGEMTMLQHLMPEQKIRNAKGSTKGMMAAEKDVLSISDFKNIMNRAHGGRS